MNGVKAVATRTMDRRTLLKLAVGASGAAVVAGVTPGPVTAQPKGQFQGVTINFITSPEVHEVALADKMSEIAKTLGMILQARFLNGDELTQKVVLDFVSGANTWDLIYTLGVQNMYEFYNRGMIDVLDGLIASTGSQSTLAWPEFTQAAQRAVRFQNRTLGIPTTTSTPAVAYRLDLFEDPRERAAFKARFGYDLAPPNSYQQFLEIGQFFTRKRGELLAGKPLDADFYGSAFPNKKGVYLWHSYENMILAYGINLYNPRTRKAEFDGPNGLAAAQMYKALLAIQPSSNLNDSSAESTALFASGHAAMIVQYFDRVVLNTIKPDVPVYGKIGYALPPAEPNHPRGWKHAFRDGPGVIAVSSRSEHKAAALQLLIAASTTEAQVDMAKKHPGYMPSRARAIEATIAQYPAAGYVLRAEADPGAQTDVGVLPYPSILRAQEIADQVSTAISSVLTGGNIQSALSTAQRQIQTTLDTIKLS